VRSFHRLTMACRHTVVSSHVLCAAHCEVFVANQLFGVASKFQHVECSDDQLRWWRQIFYLAHREGAYNFRWLDTWNGCPGSSRSRPVMRPAWGTHGPVMDRIVATTNTLLLLWHVKLSWPHSRSTGAHPGPPKKNLLPSDWVPISKTDRSPTEAQDTLPTLT